MAIFLDPSITIMKLELHYSCDEFENAYNEVVNDPDADDIIDFFDYIDDKLMDFSYSDKDCNTPKDHVFMDMSHQNCLMNPDPDDVSGEIVDNVHTSIFTIRATPSHPSVNDTIKEVVHYVLALKAVNKENIRYELSDALDDDEEEEEDDY